MQLTRHTDYALRLLMHLAVAPDGRATIQDVADTHGLSRNHLMKIVHQLGVGGFLETHRGRNGGFALARPSETIMLGDVVRHSEPNMKMADCASCALQPACGLSGILGAATETFLAVLDRHSLADAVKDRVGLMALIATSSRTPSSNKPISDATSCVSPRQD